MGGARPTMPLGTLRGRAHREYPAIGEHREYPGIPNHPITNTRFTEQNTKSEHEHDQHELTRSRADGLAGLDAVAVDSQALSIYRGELHSS